MTARNKVIVIGKGRFGSATAQGLRGSHIKTNSGDLVPVEVVHVSARKFTAMPGEMARQLTGAAFIAYCGTRLQNYADALSAGMKLARGDSTSVNTSVHDDMPSLEFLDFSNPDPIGEKDDLTGAIQLHRALGGGKGKGEWKVWKITEVSSLDMANAENASSHAMVYGEGVARGELPKLQMPGLIWTPAVGSKSDLLGEVHHRMMERASIDRWYDGSLVGIACFIFTATYAITRYSQNFNGGEPDRSILMYLLDKAFAWTGLWMMVISPYAGNVLALRGLYGRFGSLSLMYKVITVMSTLLMFIPICTFTFTWFTWVVLRAIFFRNRSFKQLYQDQTRGVVAGATKFFKACLVDLVLLKGETGCIGFIYALVHSFVGIIVADVAYKGYWFGEDGRMLWRFEASMTTGVVSTCLLMCVALRSVLGHASWIKLKPLYSYLSPMGMWFATFHVIIFGYKGWVKLGDYGYHNGQPGITFVSSSFPTCVLLTHHFMQIFGAKRQLSNSDLWQHSFINLAIQDFNKTTKTLRLGTGGYTAEQPLATGQVAEV